MKKLVAVLICLIMATSMTSCALFGGEHNKHSFRNKWEYNAGFHWHECRYDGCKEKGSYQKHTYENGKCSVCGYKEAFLDSHDEE